MNADLSLQRELYSSRLLNERGSWSRFAVSFTSPYRKYWRIAICRIGLRHIIPSDDVMMAAETLIRHQSSSSYRIEWRASSRWRDDVTDAYRWLTTGEPVIACRGDIENCLMSGQLLVSSFFNEAEHRKSRRDPVLPSYRASVSVKGCQLIEAWKLWISRLLSGLILATFIAESGSVICFMVANDIVAFVGSNITSSIILSTSSARRHFHHIHAVEGQAFRQ